MLFHAFVKNGDDWVESIACEAETKPIAVKKVRAYLKDAGFNNDDAKSIGDSWSKLAEASSNGIVHFTEKSDEYV